MAFKLKSGNKPAFKMMGSSPLHFEKDPNKLAERKKKPTGPYEKGIVYKDGKKYYKASDGSLHTGQVSDYEAELAEDKKGVGSGGNRKVMKDGAKNKVHGLKKGDNWTNKNAAKSDVQKKAEAKKKKYENATPEERKKMQDAANDKADKFHKRGKYKK
tara:strand:+ start:599 stop:1072 length:474 start_codon:yes stop_codon:yes gene_type:complete